jgi:hypothetical protein
MHLEPMLPLTDPEAWHRILVRSFLYHHDLTQIWKNEIAPSMGIPCPFIGKGFTFERLTLIALQLNAFGSALKRFDLTNATLVKIKKNLLHCTNMQTMICIREVEEYLGLE